ncbi:hypothetical protein [Streptomyces brevispora]|uniref:Uncharacterized protein n=1 Tax=Streptomyces brevispora TaxID=887462 RepID=A0ABZ1G6N0_9ACTN|nr:hypothetical protein [Streptomyces brevispora]WSC14923.1 hypothetical protein OIE64_20165 [Streptomyces brevispora]
MSDTAAVRALLDAVLDAIDIPFPAAAHDLDTFYSLLDRRVSLAVLTARGALAEDPADIQWNADYLRKRLAEHPTTGYRASRGTEAAR